MKFRKVICVLLAFVMLISGFLLPASAFPSEGDAVSEIIAPRLYSSSSGFGNIEEILSSYTDLAELKSRIYECISKAQPVLNIVELNIPRAAAVALADLVYYGMPEAFHVSGVGYTCVSDSCVESLMFYYRDYADTEKEYKKCFDAMEKAADMLLAGIENNTLLSDEEKALLLHDRLCVHNEYVKGASSIIDHTAYAALVNRSSVCQGYAMAYMYLLNRVGIRNYYCASDALYHGWNIVYIDGEAYHVDLTWDDISWGVNAAGAAGVVGHDNFLRSTNGIASTGHTANDYDASPVSTKYDNYYWQNSRTEFQLIGNKLYYIDNSAQKLMCADSGREILSVADMWRSGDHSYWVGNFSCLSSVGAELLYSSSTDIYKYNTATGESSKICSPLLSSEQSIFAFTYEDGRLICEASASPPGMGASALTRQKIRYDSTSRIITGIEIRALPAKTAYLTGESFSSDGLSINIIYSDGTRTSAYSGFTCSGFSSDTKGTKLITVTYNGYTCSFSVDVNDRDEEKPGSSGLFSDSESAVLQGKNILAVAGTSVADCLSLVSGNASVLKENGEVAEENDLIATGMLLILPDLSQKTVVVYGDVDKDGRISAADARLALRGAVNLEKYDIVSAQYLAANVNRGDALSAGDARLILRASVNLENHKEWLK